MAPKPAAWQFGQTVCAEPGFTPAFCDFQLVEKSLPGVFSAPMKEVTYLDAIMHNKYARNTENSGRGKAPATSGVPRNARRRSLRRRRKKPLGGSIGL